MENKTSPVSKDTVSLKPWTHFKTMANTEVDNTATTKGHHHDSVSTRNVVHENGYGSLSDKDRSAVIHKDVKQSQFENRIHRERPTNFETPPTQSLPKGIGGKSESDTRHCESWKVKDPSPMGAKDCHKTENSHSEVTKIVPLKPQRSKKSLNKENKGVPNPQTQSWSDRGVFGATGDVQMTESKGGSCEAGRRVDDYTVLQAATDVVKENTGAAKYQSEAAVSHPQQSLLHQQIKKELLRQQEIRDSRAPPRSLPLKTHWTRDRQSNVDSSHIHYRTASQETANKWKQAVNHQPPLTCLSIIGK
ncbi:uncharacterized protein LKV04_013215 [Tautogolabrus adspersus]